MKGRPKRSTDCQYLAHLREPSASLLVKGSRIAMPSKPALDYRVQAARSWFSCFLARRNARVLPCRACPPPYINPPNAPVIAPGTAPSTQPTSEASTHPVTPPAIPPSSVVFPIPKKPFSMDSTNVSTARAYAACVHWSGSGGSGGCGGFGGLSGGGGGVGGGGGGGGSFFGGLPRRGFSPSGSIKLTGLFATY